MEIGRNAEKKNFIIFLNIYLCFLRTLVQYGEGLLWCLAQAKEGLDSNSRMKVVFLPGACCMVFGRVTSFSFCLVLLGRLAFWKPSCWKPFLKTSKRFKKKLKKLKN